MYSFIQIPKFTGVFLFLFVIAVHCLSQTAFEAIPVDQLNFEAIREEDGLSNKAVTSIIQDRYGFLWFATFDGLNRYDGTFFKIFKHIESDSTSICNNKIGNLCEDGDGNIWGLGTQLFRYNRARGDFTNFLMNQNNPFTIPATIITGIVKDKNGDLWMSCDDDEYFLIRYHHQTEKFEPFKTKDFPVSPSQNECRSPSITIGDDGMIYMSITEGIIQFNPFNLKCDFVKLGGCANSLLFVRNNVVWADMWGRGIILVDFYSHSIKQYLQPDPGGLGYILSIIHKNNHELWIGTAGDGLFIFNTITHQFHKVKHQDRLYGFPDEKAFYCICCDRYGTFWFGTYTGILKLDPHTNQFQTTGTLTRPKEGSKTWKVGIEKATINPNDHKIYIGAYHGTGISTLDVNTHKISLACPLPLMNNEASFEDLIIGHTGKIWFDDEETLYEMVNSNGKYLVTTRAFSTSTDSFSLSKLMEDKNGNIWIGTRNNGCYKLNGANNSVTHFPRDKNKKDAYLFELSNPGAESANGDTWFYDLNHFSCFHPTTSVFEHFDRPYPSNNTSPSSYIYESSYFIGLVLDSNDHVWVGDRGHGILEFDPLNKSYHLYGIKEGLPHVGINGMSFDSRHQTIWMNTYLGIVSFDIKSHQFTTYRITEGLYAGDGISSIDFSDGKLLIGFWDGHISYASLESLNPNVEIPPVVFTQLAINGREWQGKDINTLAQINFSHDQNYLSFTFSALNYTQSKKNGYAYKLDPIDKDWVQSGARNYATYSNLRPGNYVFYVKGSNNNDIWNETGKKITIVIVPAWWQTWFFRTTLMLAVFSLIFFSTKYYFKQKIEKQKAVENIRSKISRDIHDEIGSGLTKISLMSERMKLNFDNKKDVDADLVRKITDSSKAIIDNFSEIIWTVNPKYDNLASLLGYISDYIPQFFEETAIQYTIDFPEEIPATSINPEIKRNLFLVIKESLNNILKHAGATEVSIHFHCMQQAYYFEIRDNGKGTVCLNGKDFGNGLTNMKNRMADINGSFSIVSEKNNGTSIVLKGRLNY